MTTSLEWLKTVAIDGRTYVCPTPAQMGNLYLRMAASVSDAEKKFDRLVAIVPGGQGATEALADLLGVRHISTLGARLIGEENKVQITRKLTDDVYRESVLAVGDVVDPIVLDAVSELLLTRKARSVYTAVVCDNHGSRVVADFRGFWTDEDKVIFPHTRGEFVRGVYGMWQKRCSVEEIGQRFESLGIDERQVALIMEGVMPGGRLPTLS
ncbi:MAG: hypothetical protein WCT01_00225 [Candidatus Shapirobacteria bacterium]